MERLQKVIANSGYTSRRKAEELIIQGKVSVNGEIETELGTKVNYEDVIEINGEVINKDVPKEYYLLNKPRNYICSLSDEKQRKTVVSLIDTTTRIYPVGRLDYDTTGLLLLTNDGELANILMHPSNNVEKVYIAKIEGILNIEELKKLKAGIMIDGVKCYPKYVKIKNKDIDKNTEIIEISIVEGRNHIVKRIFEAIGHAVIKLKRERYAFLDVKDLSSGEYRTLSIKEVKRLYNLKSK